MEKETTKNPDGSYTVTWKVPYKSENTKVKDLKNLYTGPPCQVCSEKTRDQGTVYTYPDATRTRICAGGHMVHEVIKLIGAPNITPMMY